MPIYIGTTPIGMAKINKHRNLSKKGKDPVQ